MEPLPGRHLFPPFSFSPCFLFISEEEQQQQQQNKNEMKKMKKMKKKKKKKKKRRRKNHNMDDVVPHESHRWKINKTFHLVACFHPFGFHSLATGGLWWPLVASGALWCPLVPTGGLRFPTEMRLESADRPGGISLSIGALMEGEMAAVEMETLFWCWSPATYSIT